MSIISLQSQIEDLHTKAITLRETNGLVALPDYRTMIESLEKMTAAAVEELNRAQGEIEAERQSYEDLFRFSRKAYFVTDLQGIIQQTNIIGSNLLGMAEKKLLGRSLLSYVHVNERSAFHLHMTHLNESNSFQNWETVLTPDTKQELNVEITVSVIRDYQGNINGLRWLVHDITQRRKIEERLRRNTGQLIESQQLGHVGSWEWDIERNEVTWSDEMYRIYGLEPRLHRVTYEDFLASVHPEDQKRVRTAVENSFKTHQPFSFDHRILRPDGTLRHLYAQGTVLLDRAGRPERMIGTGQDVTERKQSEEQLRRWNFELEQKVESRTQELQDANERLKNIVMERAYHQESILQLNRELNRRVAELETLLNVMPVGVSVAQDGQGARITTNPAGKQILGISEMNDHPTREESPYKVMRGNEEIPLEERPLYYAMAQNVLVRDVELDLEYEDGARLNLLTYASPLYDEQDQVRGGVAAYIDITKRKNAERNLTIQYAVARVLAESKGVHEASLKILQVICEEIGWEFGVFWIFDRDMNKLYVENIWQKQEMASNELAEASKKLFLSPGEGLPGQVYLSNEPLWVLNYDDQPDFLRKVPAINSGVDSVILFPAGRNDEVLGVMEFFSRKIQTPTPDLIAMFKAFASQVGEFMGHKYAEDLRALQMEQQAVITQLSKRALSPVGLYELLNEACMHMMQTLSVDFCNVLELIPADQQMQFRAISGWEESVLRSFLDLEPDSQFLYVLSENQPIQIVELSSETRFRPAPILMEHEIVSGMSVVISGRSRPFGLLEVYSKKRRLFTQNDLRFLQGVAHVLAAAIQHNKVKEALHLSRNQFSVILSGIDDGIIAQNKNGQLIYANDAAARMFGFANAHELIITPLEHTRSRFELFDESGAPVWLDQFPGPLRSEDEASPSMTIRLKVLKMGEERWTMVKSQSVTDEAGQVMLTVNIFHDITHLKHAEIGQRLLAEASVALAKDLDYKTRMVNLAELLVPSLADWCAVDILDANQKLQRAAVVHTDPQMVEWAHEIYKRYPPDPNAPTGPYNVVRTNQAEYYPMITREMIDAVDDPEQRELLHKVGLASLITVPLTARGHTFGVLSLVWAESERHYTADDLALAEELARRAALALENARLYEEAQLLNTELEERVNRRTVQLQRANVRLTDEINERKLAEEQFRRLNVELEKRVVERTSQLETANQKLQREMLERELTDEALRFSLQKTRELYEISQTMGLVNTPDELLQVLLSSSYLKSAIRASVAIFDQIWEKDSPPPETCTILTAWNKQRGALLYIGQEMTLLEYGVIEPYSRNQPMVIDDIRHEPRISEIMRERLTSMGVVGSVIFPLIAGGKWYGVLSLHFDQIATLNADDIRHLQGLVDEVAMGIHNFRLLEAEAHARYEAEEANSLKLKFLAMISHELRTPLTSIKGFSTTLLADDVEWKPENQRDFIETISSEADKLTELIEQLLDLSRLEAGTIRIIPQHVEWNQVLMTARAQLQSLTANHHLVIESSEVDSSILNVDVMRVSQVITNLVNNSVKYSPENTTIIIVAEKFSEQFIKVRVIDEGIGIPHDARNRVFEAFQQLDRTETVMKGAGLGLAICRALVEVHGGRIWVDEHSGDGTTMSFTLPLAD